MFLGKFPDFPLAVVESKKLSLCLLSGRFMGKYISASKICAEN